MKNFLALILFIGGLAGWYFYDQFQKMKTQLVETRKNINAYDETLTSRREEYQSIVAALELQKKVEFRKAEINALRAKAEEARIAVQNMRGEHAAIIREIRGRFVGQLVSEFILADGRKLTNVRISKVDETGVALTSPSGVTKLRPAELSPEFKAKFYY